MLAAILLYRAHSNARRLIGELRRQCEISSAALENIAHGLSMFDGDGRLIIANSRYAEMYDIPADRIIPGVSTRTIQQYHHQSGQLPDMLDKWEQEVSEGGLTSARREVSLRDGRAVDIVSVQLENGDWITTHEDVTERRRLLAELEQQYQISTAALDNMVLGLSMYDRDNRLIVWNRRYVEIFGFPEGFLQSGMSGDDVLNYQVDSGLVIGSFAEHRRGPGHRVMTLRDGRIIKVHSKRLENGIWIATQEDVTERERLHAQLERQCAISAAALDNMAHGLSMFDENSRLIIGNRRYAEIYGIPEDALVPGTPLSVLLRHVDEGGRMDASFANYEQVSRDWTSTSGELEVRLRNGRIVKLFRRQLENGGWIATHEDVTERHQANEQIAYLATHDDLTGLANRRSFVVAIEDGMRAAGGGDCFALLTIDLDRFKEVNDTLGHPIGDQILKETAARLRSIVPAEDGIVRLGGDEFAVIQRDVSKTEDAAQLAAQVVDLLGEPYEFDGHTITVGATVGIALADGCSADELVKRSDLALYRAKNQSRGSYCFFEHGMDARLCARRELEMGLRVALQKGEFELFYQPLLDVASNRIASFEALVRWHHPSRGLLQPLEFIPTAEDSGLIIPIGEWVLRQACRDAARWPSDVHVSVNLSAAQLKRGDFLAMTKSALAAAGLPPERLEIELTESVLLHDEEWVRAQLLQLRALGVRIAMDDFGTGYSSLSYLRTFPFSKIKIDKSFVSDMNGSRDALAIVQATIDLSMKLGMCTTAEGVETAEQMDMLIAEGCTQIQGYCVSRPVPADRIWPILIRYAKADMPPLKAAS
jgi:diguanylate cyclase (GGDEF)-like protein